MTTIGTESGKFRFNCLPMGMCASVYISQAKLDGLIGDIEVVKTYIGDILVLSKYYFIKHIEQMMIIFGTFCEVVLKYNTPKGGSLSKLCNNKVGYKSQPKESTRYHGSWVNNHHNRSASAHRYGVILYGYMDREVTCIRSSDRSIQGPKHIKILRNDAL